MLNPVLVFVVLGVGVLASAVLLLASLFPRRRGDVRFCRKCGYNLTGVVSQRCPECGGDLEADRAVVKGERRVRRRLAAASGFALLILAAALVGVGWARAKGVDWRRHAPTHWLLSEFGGEDSIRAGYAVSELKRRWQANELTPAATERLAELCLAEQARPESRSPASSSQAGPDVDRIALGILGGMYDNGTLSEQQCAAFHENFVQLRLTAREVVPVGVQSACRLKASCRTPTGAIEAYLEPELFYNNELVDDPFAFMFLGALGLKDGTTTTGGSVVCADEPGLQEIRAEVIVRIVEAGTSYDKADVAPLYEFTRTLTTRVRIVEKETVECLPAANDDETAVRLRGALNVQLLRALAAPPFWPEDEDSRRVPNSSAAGASGWWISGLIGADVPLPVDVVAKVQLRWNGVRRDVGCYESLRGKGVTSSFHLDSPATPPEFVDVILAPSKELAYLEPEAELLWWREIVFEHVPITFVSTDNDRCVRHDADTETLFRDLDSEDDMTVWGALCELVARADDGRLDADQVAAVIGLCFREALHSRERPHVLVAAKYLSDLDEQGRLSAANAERFTANLLHWSPEIHPTRCGDPIVIHLNPVSRLKRENVTPHMDVCVSVAAVGADAGARGRGDGFRLQSRWLDADDDVITMFGAGYEPGKNQAVLDATLKGWRRVGWGEDSVEETLGDRHFEVEFEILPSDAPDRVTSVRSSEFDQAVLDSFFASQVIYAADRGSAGLSCQFVFRKPLPVPIAFEVAFRCGDKEYQQCDFWLRAGRTGASNGQHLQGPPVAPEVVDVIFRPSRRVALNLPGEHVEHWGGGLIMRDVPVVIFGGSVTYDYSHKAELLEPEE